MDLAGYPVPDWFVIAVILLLALLLVLIVIWAIRRSHQSVRKMEIEVEKQKLDLLAKDLDTRAKEHPFTKLSTDQIQSIRTLEDENELLELNNYHREKIVEARLRKLENLVREAKLERMILKLDLEEKKVK
jgi:flagellar biosynthesis/type III secretory pathway M-ring protein FliF/YscJ